MEPTIASGIRSVRFDVYVPGGSLKGTNTVQTVASPFPWKIYVNSNKHLF